MDQATEVIDGALLEKALAHMTSALKILDTAQAPAEIGAHLDLALHHLRGVVASKAYEQPRSGVWRQANGLTH